MSMRTETETEIERLRAENRELRDLCRHILPVFEAARPLVLTMERLRYAVKEPAS